MVSYCFLPLKFHQPPRLDTHPVETIQPGAQITNGLLKVSLGIVLESRRWCMYRRESMIITLRTHKNPVSDTRFLKSVGFLKWLGQIQSQSIPESTDWNRLIMIILFLILGKPIIIFYEGFCNSISLSHPIFRHLSLAQEYQNERWCKHHAWQTLSRTGF